MPPVTTSRPSPDIGRLELALLHLAPALQERRASGLLLRHSRGFLPAANCAVPCRSAESVSPQDQLRTAEDFFTRAGQTVQWLIGQRPANEPLLDLLPSVGYQSADHREIWFRDLRQATAAQAGDHKVRIRLLDDPAQFAAAYGRLAGQSRPAVELQTLRLRALAQGHTLALFIAEGGITANPAPSHGAPLGCLLALAVNEPAQEQLTLAASDSGRIGLLGDLFIARDARRRGIASLLLRTAGRWLGARQCAWSVLEVAEKNHQARRLYRRHAYELAGRWAFWRAPLNNKTA